MKRLLAIALSLSLALSGVGVSAQTLEEGFRNPPRSAKPYSWWHWMNGNISKEGVTADLEAMAAAGYGGVQCFNISIMTQGPVDYGSDEWYEITNFAIKECERLGLEFDMHNCPGWSSTGGMWITPEDAGKQVSWSYAFVKGGKQVDMQMPQPTKALDSYWDDVLIAYPSTKDETIIEDYLVKATVDGAPADIKKFSMGAPDNTVRFTSEVILELSKEVFAQSVIGFFKNEPVQMTAQQLSSMRNGFGGAPSAPAPTICFSKDGQSYTQPRNISVLSGAVSYATLSETFKYVKIATTAPVYLNGLQISAAAFNDGFLRSANFEMSAGGGGGFGMGMPRGGVAPGAGAVAKQIDAYAVDPTSVIDISKYMDVDGHLVWDAPAGSWTIVRIGYVPIDRHTKMGSTVGDGLEIDKYSRKALDAHWDALFPKLMKSYERIGKAVKGGILIDSYEAGNCNWTPLMRQEFKERRGYDMLGYLPSIIGRYVKNEDVTTRFLWDFRRNCADMFADNYVGHYAELAHEHGLLIYNEPYNSSVFEEMQTGSRADITMGEFWARTYQDRATIKMAASIAHIAGKRIDGQQIVAAESFSGWQQQAGYQGFPYAYKAEGDDMYTQGLNRFIFHRFVHQPNVYAKPGMSMGNIGSHIDANNTWYEKGHRWFKYIARTQFLLQQGNIVSDVLYLVSEDVPGSSHGTWNPALPFGYTGDAINAELLLGTCKIQGADLVAADDLHYKLLMIANANGGRTMTIDVLRRIAEYVEAGGSVLGEAPVSTPNLSSDAELKEFASIVTKLWGGIEKGGVKNVGKGRVFNTEPQAALDALGIVPDVQYSFTQDAPVGFIHRQAQGVDIYFLANHRRTAESIVATFRVNGRRPELWNSDTGEITPLNVYDVLADGRVRVNLQFDPAGSWFVIFREPAQANHYTAIAYNGQDVIQTALYDSPRQKGGLYPDVKDNFTISVWLRPETNDGVDNNLGVSGGGMFSGNLSSYPYVIGDPVELYGPGNAIAGIVATRFGVSVMQNGGVPAGGPAAGGRGGFGGPGGFGGGSRASAVASSVDKLSSWNHIAAVYTDGVPQLYVNGELKATGQKATASVHPAFKDVAYAHENHFFEGDFAEYAVYDHPLTSAEIKAIADKGVPAPDAPAEVKYASDGGLIFFENGIYTATTAAGTTETIKVKGIPEVKDLTANGWTVCFPPKLGAPEQITLDKLMPLQNHPMDGVKYFSGTATYKTTFNLSAKELKNKQLYLDLGRVYVIASVKLNGQDLGVVWKEPYMVEITSAAKAGANELEVEVANLWTNRLIGDAFVPNPYGEERGDSGIIPEWYIKNQPKPEDGRVAFSVVTFYDSSEPLYDSGLVGPVIIRSAIKK